MKEEPGKHPGQPGDSVVSGDHEVDQVVVGFSGVLPHVAPLEAHLRAQVSALPTHYGLSRHLLGPVQPPEIL